MGSVGLAGQKVINLMGELFAIGDGLYRVVTGVGGRCGDEDAAGGALDRSGSGYCVELGAQVGDRGDGCPHLPLGTQAGDEVNFGVEDLGGEFAGFQAVTERAAGQRVRVEDGAGVAELEQFPGAGQTGRAGADDGDAFAGGGLAGGEPVVGVVQINFGDMAVQGADGNGGTVRAGGAAAASFLTEAGANVAQHAGEHQGIAGGLDGAGHVVLADLPDHLGDIEVRRADLAAGGEAFAGVFGQQEFQSSAAGEMDIWGGAFDDHAIGDLGGAGGNHALGAVDADDADQAACLRLDAFEIAQVGDGDAGGFGGLQNRSAIGGENFDVVNHNFGHNRI